LILLHFPTRHTLSAGYCRKTVAKPPTSPGLSQNASLVGRPVQLLKRFAFHLQLHLRVLLEHLRVPLPE
jgi:hypothetical protein